MEFDSKIKDTGDWYYLASNIDDVAYYLFLKICDRNNEEDSFIMYATQQKMIEEYIKSNKYNYSYYYKKAHIILRKDKLNKIIDNVTT